MTNQQQTDLDFLKEATLGLLNKQGISFELTSRRTFDGGKEIRILLVNDKSISSGNHQRLKIYFYTNNNDVRVEYSYSLYENNIFKRLTRVEAVDAISGILYDPNQVDVKEIPTTNGLVDFYDIVSSLHEEVFVNADDFELQGWHKTVYLHDEMEVGYSEYKNELHVHGGVGVANKIDSLHGITTTIELGTLIENDRVYMGVIKEIAENTNYPEGLYEDATVDMFVEAILEQYKGARNKKVQ